MDYSQLRSIIREELSTWTHIDAEDHEEQHEFLKLWIDREKRHREMCATIKTQVAGWGIVVMIAWIGKTVASKFGVMF